MIQASELRLGNYFQNPDTKKYHVIDTSSFMDMINEAQVNNGVIINIDPIHLSEDVLAKCGFEKHKNSNEYWDLYANKTGFQISASKHNEPSAGVKVGKFYWGNFEAHIVEFEYLHTLQNLIHSLTGTELEVKL